MKCSDYSSLVESEERNQEDCSVSDKFGIIAPCSATYYLELGSHVTLKAAKVSFGGKKNSENLDLWATFLK